MVSMNVMLTGVGGGGHGEQILKALRLGKVKYNIVGGDMSSISKGLMEVDTPYILPAANDPSYIDTVIKICKKHNVKALFHGSEPELRVMSDNRDQIEGEGIFLPINPKRVIDICMDKYQTMKFLEESNFSFPRSVAVRNIEELESINFNPTVLKPSVGGGGSANLFLAQSKDELMTFGKYLLNIYPEFIVQEYVGTPEGEFTVGVLISMDGELINSIAVKRMILSSLSNRIKVPNLTGNEKLGKTLAISSGVSQGEIGRYEEVTKKCEELALKLGCKGAVNIQCRYQEGKVYVFEINPRFSGTTSLRAMVGYNEPDVLIRKHLLGETIEPFFSYSSGYIMRGLQEVYISNLSFSEAKNL